MASRGISEEVVTFKSRTTKEGRVLNYKLSVIQQPERARACGSGAKSSADRRPVDPPPVVELKIYSDEQDITFQHNANFFLYATLECARPMAHGRVQPSAPQIPVLTGMPVSGMAYLDRPTEAGYFIFPDLSVRHEGRYKLSFNLYEEVKEDKDADADGNEAEPKNDGGLDAAFVWRMEVKSLPFTVFSAKKFPGLAESTGLSRTIAEQGCRVRIRRDVRMRRRDEKSQRDFEDTAEEAYVRRGRTATPSEHGTFRNRSSSGERPVYPEQRRPSLGDYQSAPYPHSTHSYPAPPPTPHSAGPPHYLGFGAPPGQYQAPLPPPAYAQPPLTPSHPTHHQAQYRQPAQQQANYGYAERQPYAPQYAAPAPGSRDSFEPEYRRASVAYPPHPSPVAHNAYPVDHNYNRPAGPPYVQYEPQSLAPSRTNSIALPPLNIKPDHPQAPVGQPLSSVTRIGASMSGPSMSGASVSSASMSGSSMSGSSMSGASMSGASMSSSMSNAPMPSAPMPSASMSSPPYERMPDRLPERQASYSQYMTGPPLIPDISRNTKRGYEAEERYVNAPALIPDGPRSAKRTYGDFQPGSQQQPLRNGERPSSPQHGQAYDEDEIFTMAQMKMTYKRADGQEGYRHLPSLV